MILQYAYRPNCILNSKIEFSCALTGNESLIDYNKAMQ